MIVSYEFDKWFTLMLGGSPKIGALVYGSMLFDLDRNLKGKKDKKKNVTIEE